MTANAPEQVGGFPGAADELAGPYAPGELVHPRRNVLRLDRPWFIDRRGIRRRCRFPSPSPQTAALDVPTCAPCGRPLLKVRPAPDGSGRPWRHRPAVTARRVLSLVVNRSPLASLALSEVELDPDTGYPQEPGTGAGRSSSARATAGELVAASIAAHLSPRAALSVADPTTPHAQAQRAAYVLDALALAARCPMCAPDVAGLVP
jgi:hypothetical protein